MIETTSMPLYELFCLARPQLQAAQNAELLRKAASTIFAGGGVLMDLKSFGVRPTAYKVAGALAGERHNEVSNDLKRILFLHKKFSPVLVQGRQSLGREM